MNGGDAERHLPEAWYVHISNTLLKKAGLEVNQGASGERPRGSGLVKRSSNRWPKVDKAPVSTLELCDIQSPVNHKAYVDHTELGHVVV